MEIGILKASWLRLMIQKTLVQVAYYIDQITISNSSVHSRVVRIM